MSTPKITITGDIPDGMVEDILSLVTEKYDLPARVQRKGVGPDFGFSYQKPTIQVIPQDQEIISVGHHFAPRVSSYCGPVGEPYWRCDEIIRYDIPRHTLHGLFTLVNSTDLSDKGRRKQEMRFPLHEWKVVKLP